MQQNEEELLRNLVILMKSKNYSKESAEIICTICNSEQAYNLGFTFSRALTLAINCVEQYDNERECINALIEIIK